MGEPAEPLHLLGQDRAGQRFASRSARVQRLGERRRRIEIPDLARDLRRAIGRIEPRDAADAAASGNERGPRGGGRVADGRNGTESGDGDPTVGRGGVVHDRERPVAAHPPNSRRSMRREDSSRASLRTGSSMARAKSSAPTSELMRWVTRSRFSDGSPQRRSASHQPVEVPGETARIPGAGGTAQPRNIGANRHDHAPGIPVIAMMVRQITVDQESRARRPAVGCAAMRSRSGQRRFEGGAASLRHELRFVPEMRVKAAMSEPGTPHHLIDAGFRNPALAKRLPSRREDATAGGDFIGLADNALIDNEKITYWNDNQSNSTNLKRAYMTVVIPSRKPVFVEETLTLTVAVVLLPGLFLMQQLHAYWRMEYIEAHASRP